MALPEWWDVIKHGDMDSLWSAVLLTSMAIGSGYTWAKNTRYYGQRPSLTQKQAAGLRYGSPLDLWAGGVKQGFLIHPKLYAAANIFGLPLLQGLVNKGVIRPEYEYTDTRTGGVYTKAKLSALSKEEYANLQPHLSIQAAGSFWTKTLTKSYMMMQNLAEGDLGALAHTSMFGGMFRVGTAALNSLIGDTVTRLTATGRRLKFTLGGKPYQVPVTGTILGGAQKVYNFTLGGAFGGEGLVGWMQKAGYSQAAFFSQMFIGLADEAFIEPFINTLWQTAGVQREWALNILEEFGSSGIEYGYVSPNISRRIFNNEAVNTEILISKGIIDNVGNITGDLVGFLRESGLDSEICDMLSQDKVLQGDFVGDVLLSGAVNLSELTLDPAEYKGRALNGLMLDEMVASFAENGQLDKIMNNKNLMQHRNLSPEAKQLLGIIEFTNPTEGEISKLAKGLRTSGREHANEANQNLISRWVEGNVSSISAKERYHAYSGMQDTVQALKIRNPNLVISNNFNNRLQERLEASLVDYAPELVAQVEAFTLTNKAPPSYILADVTRLIDTAARMQTSKSSKAKEIIKTALDNIASAFERAENRTGLSD